MKLLADAMKKNKSSNAKRRSRKSTTKAEEKLEVVEVSGDKENESDIIIVSKKKKLEAHDNERNRSSDFKFGSHGVSRKKYIALKRKKVSKDLVPRREILMKRKSQVMSLRE